MFLNFIIIILVLILAYSIIPTYIYKFNHKLFKQDNKKEKSFYLTFDDGPSVEYTSSLLDLLKEHDVRATFL